MYGLSLNQVFPRVYSKEEFAQVKAKVLLILGEKGAIYKLRSAMQAARTLLPNAEFKLAPDAHHITALPQPALVNQRLCHFFANSAATT